ncbi:YhdH/YhfP family quinone oxidoreductase [Desulfobulbus oligotrophicus]|uniref:YhdH/YhfP family quinone oxidoreductase n=1 Tax=Desulfobulbus oligotrophicus TaxID=1909699 RepID=A0A7T5VCU1_9BACT|nr:YhdH/YhfP family quinone oxidoreductase [Desulfobulbus oligotrophicus]QQG65524.1 YhdH/YhfP family quinone oxidoreductase [Desulfobulbus oligotrophicus]
MNDKRYRALVAYEAADNTIQRRIEQKDIDSLPAGDVLIRVHYSSLNYKDALSASGNRGVTKQYPHTPGIDAAGIVVTSTDPAWQKGDPVICTGYDLGMNIAGGFGQYIRVPGSWLVRLPPGLTLLESMRLGTAGFTAAQCVWHLERNNITPDKGPVLVTGASGGVGTVAIVLLRAIGYKIIAVTGKPSEHAFLTGIGAHTVMSRKELLKDADKLLLPTRWHGVVDTVGGAFLAAAIKGTAFDGVVTCCGNASSSELALSVYPFILRGVHLIGVYSANCPMERRVRIWEKLAGEWKIDRLDTISRLVSLDHLEVEMKAMLAGKGKGRCVVDLGGAEDVS